MEDLAKSAPNPAVPVPQSADSDMKTAITNLIKAQIDTTGRFDTIERAFLEQTQILRTQNANLAELTLGVTGVMDSFKSIVSNVLDIRNGIVPPEFMRIADFKTILEANTVSFQQIQTDAIKSNGAFVNKILWTFGILLAGALVSKTGGAFGEWILQKIGVGP